MRILMQDGAWEPFLVKDARKQLSIHWLHKEVQGGACTVQGQRLTPACSAGRLRVKRVSAKRCAGIENRALGRQGYRNEYKREEMEAEERCDIFPGCRTLVPLRPL